MGMQEEEIKRQLTSRGIRDPRVLKAMAAVPREFFVPEIIREQAYGDNALPIGFEQTISQPYIVAYMSELLEVQKNDKVLEIGTGSGYQAAVLAELEAHVYTVEIVGELYEQAHQRLAELKYSRIHLKKGDGWKGWTDEAPFDKVMVTAAAPEIPEALIRQLKEGGRMVLPIGKREDIQRILLGVKRHGNIETLDKIPVRFVPLVHQKNSQEK